VAVAHPEVVRESLARYSRHLESIQLELTPAGKTAADHLVQLLSDAQRFGTDLSSVQVSFRSSDLENLPNKDLDLMMNQFVLGSGNDGAAVVFMGTEEAFFNHGGELDRGSLALGQFAWAVAWLTDSQPDVMRAIEPEPFKDFDAAPFHRHPYDVVRGGHRLVGTWGALAKIVAAWRGGAAAPSYLEDRGHPRLGDLAYLIERSAAPSKKAAAGLPPKPQRLDFLAWILGHFEGAQVLVLYGSTGSSAGGGWREANETLGGTFLRSTQAHEHSIRVGTVTLRWRDHTDRRVILSPAVGGGAFGVGHTQSEFVGKLIREVVPVG